MAKITKAEEEEKIIAAAYKQVFSTPSGKIVLEDMKSVCHFFTTTNESGVANPETMIYREGRRSVVLDLISLANASEETVKEYVDSLKPEEGEK